MLVESGEADSGSADLPLRLVEGSESFQPQGQERGTFLCEELGHLALGGAVELGLNDLAACLALATTARR